VASHAQDPAAQELSRVADALLKRTARENRTLPLATR
jgi:hypothetical protein